jgi:hypothetical protein
VDLVFEFTKDRESNDGSGERLNEGVVSSGEPLLRLGRDGDQYVNDFDV